MLLAYPQLQIKLKKLKKKFRHLNSYEYKYEDVIEICKSERIRIKYMRLPADIKGYYQNDLKNVYRKRYIVLNENLSRIEQVFVILHELIHHWIHVSMAKHQTFFCRVAELIDSKQDKEADELALIMFIPQYKLFEFNDTPFEEIHPFVAEKLVERQKIYEDSDGEI